MKTPRSLFLLFALLTMAAFAGSKTYSYTYDLQRGWNLIGIHLGPSEETQEQLKAYQFYEFSTQGALGVFSKASEITRENRTGSTGKTIRRISPSRGRCSTGSLR